MKPIKPLLAGLALTLCLSACGGDDFYDPNATTGLLDGRTEEEISALQNQSVADGMLQFSINSNPVFATGTSQGNLRIENAPGNPYDIRVTITLVDSGVVVYSSGGLKPNSYIENDVLDMELGAGEYDATAKFYAVDEDHKDIGVVTCDVTLTVLG